MEKINVMYVVYCLEPGGLENVVVNVVNNLNPEFFKPFICSFKKDGFLKHRIKEGIEIIEINKGEKNDFFLPFRLKRLFKKKNIHVVHTHNWATCCEGIIGALLASVPVIIHAERGTFVNMVGQKRRRIWAERLLFNWIDQVMTVSEDLREIMIKYLHLNKQKIIVIGNGVDVEKFACLDEKKQQIRK